MKSFFHIAALAASASAAVLRRDQCCFQIIATGGVSGVMGQLSDGQNRINGSYPPATYCYSNGGIIDSSGRGCVVTYTNDATHQFQCDLNSAPTYGFTIASNGSILYQGSDQFYACPATNTEYNVYTTWLTGQDKCKPITLRTNGTCAGAAPSGGVSTASSSVPGYSIPAYTSQAESSATAYSVSASSYTSEVQSTTPAYSTSGPAYSTRSQSTGFSAPSASESVPAQTPTSQSSESVPAYSSVASVPAYSVESSSTAVPQSYDTTVVAFTTYYTTYCPETETQVSGGSTFTSVYSTWSTFTSVGSSSMPAESATTVPAYSTPSSVVATTGVVVASSSAATVPVYSSVQTIVSSVATSASVPGYSSTPAQSSASPVAVTSETQASIPGYGTSTSVVASSTSAVSTPAVSSYESSSTQPATSTSVSACQTSLTGAYQTPHLIVPISSTQPDTAYGTQYDATINSTTSTIFNFDIPSSYSGMTCSVIFLFPEQADLETSAYTFSGSGSLVFAELNGVATEETTYDNAPSVESTLDTIAIQSGNSYVVATGSCAAGTTESIELSSSGGLSLEFFEDWNPSSLGLYITAC